MIYHVSPPPFIPQEEEGEEEGEEGLASFIFNDTIEGPNSPPLSRSLTCPYPPSLVL
jgi:hypothetical protein